MLIFRRDQQNFRALRNQYPFLDFFYISDQLKLTTKIFRLANRQMTTRISSANSPILKPLRLHFLHVAIKRYLIALDIVRNYGNAITNVLLTDSRDVLIQQNPFPLIQDRLICGLEAETMTIKSCPINSAWIKSLYGEEGLRRLGDRPIVCSGVTMGSAQVIEHYLSEMCNEIGHHLPNAASSDGIDQGIHNYLIGTDKITPTTVNNRSGIIATLGYEQPSAISQDLETGCIKVYGKYPAIVHQYDRHPKLTVNPHRPD